MKFRATDLLNLFQSYSFTIWLTSKLKVIIFYFSQIFGVKTLWLLKNKTMKWTERKVWPCFLIFTTYNHKCKGFKVFEPPGGTVIMQDYYYFFFLIIHVRKCIFYNNIFQQQGTLSLWFLCNLRGMIGEVNVRVWMWGGSLKTPKVPETAWVWFLLRDSSHISWTSFRKT